MSTKIDKSNNSCYNYKKVYKHAITLHAVDMNFEKVGTENVEKNCRVVFACHLLCNYLVCKNHYNASHKTSEIIIVTIQPFLYLFT